MDMPINPYTGNYNVTHTEVAVAQAANPEFVREDGTLTRAGQLFVAREREARLNSNGIRA